MVYYMARTTLIVTDKNFRITIPEEIRMAEEIKQGDMIEIDVKNLGKHDDWYCRKKIFTKDHNEHIRIVTKKSAIVSLLPGTTATRIRIPTTGEYGIQLTLSDSNGIDLPENVIIRLWKEKQISFDGHAPSGDWLEDCTYAELKRKFKPRNEILISPDELLALYIEENEYVKKGIGVENIRFTVDLCIKK